MEPTKMKILIDAVWHILKPHSATEKLFYWLNTIGVSGIIISNSALIKAYLELYVILITAVTMTITLVVKIYNLSREKADGQDKI